MPLAHILYPQIAKKTEEIEAALAPGYLERPLGEAPIVAPSQARGRGYLGPRTDPADAVFSQNVRAASEALPGDAGRAFSQGYYKGSTEEHGRQVQDRAQREIQQFQKERAAAPAAPSVGFLRVAAPPTASEAGLRALRDAPPNSPWQVFKNAAILGAAEESRRQKGMQLLPAAPVPEPVAAAPRKGGVIPLPKGAVGVDETGQAVDKKGKRLGYLAQPAMVTPYGDMPMRTAKRRPNDILITKDGGLLDDDAFGTFHLQQMYGKHLKEMRENRDAQGMPTDKFPEGYFKGMTKKQRENIIHGVEALRALEAGTRT